MDVTKFDNGRFCWAELSTTDGQAAKEFYTTLMGWEAVDNPMGEGMVYTMLTVDGKNIGALYQDNSGKAPPYWGTYIASDNVDAAAAKVKELGGTLLAEPFDVMEHGRMAVVQDPTGAVFCIWQAKEHIGFGLVDDPGSVCWNELNTRDPKSAGAFYSGLFGYSLKASEMPMPYTEMQLEGKSVAGMMEMGPEMEGVPPNWLMYYTVTSCDETLVKATSLGASVIMPAMDIPGVGKFAIIKDPQGAVFAFIS